MSYILLIIVQRAAVTHHQFQLRQLQLHVSVLLLALQKLHHCILLAREILHQ